MTIGAAEFTYLRDLVERRAGILLAGKEYLAETRLEPILHQEACGTLADLVTRLRSGDPTGALQAKVVNALTTNETSFFRDQVPFAYVKTHLLPALSKARPDAQVRIWSAACSTGQEPYTLALMLKEDFPQLRARILATDINSAVVEKARTGRYTQLEVNRGVPAQMLVRWFRRQGLEWQLNEQITGMVDFRVANLIDAWAPMEPFDLVLLRNVLIYFSETTRARILKRVRAVVKPGGALIVGGSEAATVPSELFRQQFYGPQCVFHPKE